MITVCILNFFKTGVMLIVWWMRKYQWAARKDHEKHVVYTLGDAIRSFVRNPETKTEDMCLADISDFRRRRNRKSRFVKPELVLSKEPRKWEEQKRHWAAAASVRRWVFLISMYVGYLRLSSALTSADIFLSSWLLRVYWEPQCMRSRLEASPPVLLRCRTLALAP